MQADGSTPKVNAEGNPDLRPIGMGTTLLALICRAALHSQKASLTALLAAAGQYGFGVPSGVEAVAAAVATWLADADDQALQSVVGTWDGRAAYPSISRAAMIEAVRTVCPALLPLFLLVYGGPRTMIWGRRSAGVHRIDKFVCEEGTVQGCVLASLGYCLAILPAMRRTRAAFPDVHIAAIIDDTNFLTRAPGRASEAIQFWSGEMAALGVQTVVAKTLVTASDNCDLSGGVAGATVAADGINFVGCPIASESAADAFAATFITKRLSSSLRQLSRLHLLGDAHVALRLLQTTYVGRARYLASLVPGDWAGGRPLAGRALYEFAAALRAAAEACYTRSLPARAWGSVSEGGVGLRLIASAEEHAYVFLSCQLRVLRTLRHTQPALAAALLASSAPHSFSSRVSAARAALPGPAAGSATPPVPALFSLDDSKARALSEARKKGMAQWRRAELERTLFPGERLALKLSSSEDSVGGLFLASLSSAHHIRNSAMVALVLTYLGLPAPGLESLATAADPMASSVFAKPSAAKIAAHNLGRDALGRRCKRAGRGVQVEVTGRFGPLPTDNAGEPAPGAERMGVWRRLDLEDYEPMTGSQHMLDITLPCGTTGPRIAAFAAGGAWDKHILDAERGKFTKYADKPDGFSIVPAVVGMYGEVGGQLTLYLAGLATSAAEREQLGDPKLTRLFRQRFLYETRLELSIALARGKALMIDAARDKLAGITAQRARASPQ